MTPHPIRSYPLLERFAGFVLILVLAALVGIVIASFFPSRVEGQPPPEVVAWYNSTNAVAAVTALIVLALVLVSVLALLHTREAGES